MSNKRRLCKRPATGLRLLSGLLLGLVGTTTAQADASLEQGRYLVQIAGCNDCHTAGYMARNGEVPEGEWLQGSPLGWNGPWGTTYASNLRLYVADMTEAQWLQRMRNLRSRPPMPWFGVVKMREDDLRSLYRYLRHLGPAGEAMPAALPPGQSPAPPFARFPGPPPAP